MKPERHISNETPESQQARALLLGILKSQEDEPEPSPDRTPLSSAKKAEIIIEFLRDSARQLRRRRKGGPPCH